MRKNHLDSKWNLGALGIVDMGCSKRKMGRELNGEKDERNSAFAWVVDSTSNL